MKYFDSFLKYEALKKALKVSQRGIPDASMSLLIYQSLLSAVR